MATGKAIVTRQECIPRLHFKLQKEVVLGDNGKKCGDLLPTLILEGLSLLDLVDTIDSRTAR